MENAIHPVQVKHFIFRSRLQFMLLLCLFCFLYQPDAHSQMMSSVTSLEDDEKAHPYDIPETMDTDESMDGICSDELGRCTLRAAIEEAANLGLSADVVINVNGTLAMDPLQGAFNIPDNSIITASDGGIVNILGNPGDVIFTIENDNVIYGIGMSDALYGIIIGGNNNLIGSVTNNKNYITHMSESGILVQGDDNRIVGNVIGLERSGNPGPSKFGIFLVGKNNIIGGSDPDQGNVISGNDIGIGVYTFDTSGISKNYIKGNWIGTNPSGTAASPNRVGIDNIGPQLAIGGLTPSEANVISGNTESGILIGTQANGVFVGGNRIGVDKSGTIAIPNRDGITLGPGSFNCVVEFNTISQNTQNGILISGIPDPMLHADHHIIRGNEIFSNGNAGIAITGAANDNIIGSSLTQNYAPNHIAENGASGILIAPSLTNPQRNTIRDDSFQDNGLLGIQIIAGQGSIQPPVFESYIENGNTAIVLGTHNLPGATIDLYAADVNPANQLEGIDWLGSGPVDGNGFFSIQISSCTCDSIVATATDAIGNTSEFSDGISVITAVGDPAKDQQVVSVFPNPFVHSTTIGYELQHTAEVDLKILDMTGQVIQNLCHDRLSAGRHQWSWDATAHPAGLYYYRLTLDTGHIISGKLISMQ